jgi:hypothetical protein
MNEKGIQPLARKATAILGAIAASSFLGLPVLAQTNSSQTNQYTQCVPVGAQSSNSTNSQSYTANSTTTSTPGTSSGAVDVSPSGDASNAGVPVLPNQSDPRSIPSTQGSSISNDMGTNPDVNNSSSTTGSSSTSSSYRMGSSNSSMSSDANTDANSSYQTTNYIPQNNGSAANPTYRDILARGGATAGAQARMLMQRSQDPNWHGDRSDRRVSYNYGQDQAEGSQIPTSGVTSGAQVSNYSGSSTTQANNCPPGMVPRMMQNNQQLQDQAYPDTPGRERANPNRYQTPSNQ